MEAAAELQDLYSNYQKSKSSFSPENFKDKYAELFREKGIVYLIYANDSLVFWSDNSPSVENYRKEICLDNSIVKLRNGWYEVVEHPQSNKNKEHFIALILLKREFAYQNKYLKSGFPDYFKTPDFLKVNANPLGQYSVKNFKGVKLFEFENASTTELKHGNNNLMMVLFLIQYMLLIVLLYAVSFQVLPERLGNLRLMTFSLAGMVILILLKYFGIPENLINSSLYNPEI
ncbi:MAG: hypothetical protein ACK452_17000, partial [Bacteroidota bacterium]